MLEGHINGMCSEILVAIAGKIGINAPEGATGPLYDRLKAVGDVHNLRPAVLEALHRYWKDRAAVVIDIAEVAEVCRPGTDGVTLRTIMDDVAATADDLIAEDEIVMSAARRAGAAGPEPTGEVRKADLGRARMTEHGTVRASSFDEDDDDERHP